MTVSLRTFARSRCLRVLGVLAWLMLATSSLQAAPLMIEAQPFVAAHAAATVHEHCNELPAARMASQPGHAPAMPMGHGDCCHGGCHCLAACGAVITVPRSMALQQFAPVPLPRFASTDPIPTLAAPPLRPPIA
ncbi:MAG: hypothetical protein ACREP2_14870 [Rhodanobacteraceae bacterium]